VDVPGRFEGFDCSDVFADVATSVGPHRRWGGKEEGFIHDMPYREAAYAESHDAGYNGQQHPLYR